MLTMTMYTSTYYTSFANRKYDAGTAFQWSEIDQLSGLYVLDCIMVNVL